VAYKIQISYYAQSWIRNIREVPSRVQSYFEHLHVKRLVKAGRVLERVRSNDGVPKMIEKAAIKDLFYGGVVEIMNNRNYYYKSSVGSEYNHLTEAGIKVMSDYMNVMAGMIADAEEASLNKRAKDLVISGLKGEKV
jgi:hypothetical protein